MFFLTTVLLWTSFAQGANILGVFMFPSESHQVVHQAIYRQLSLRGHKVTAVTPIPLNDPSLTNLTEISLSFITKLYPNVRMDQILDKDKSARYNMLEGYNAMYALADIELNSTQFQKLLADKSLHFDLILTEYLYPTMYGLAEKYKAPIIGVSTFGALTPSHDIVGNPSFPVVNPDVLLNINFKKLSMWDKICSVSHSLWARYNHWYFERPRADKLAKKYFPDHVEFVGDIERRQSILFLDTNPIIHWPRANIPSVVEMGFVHITPPKPLPQDLQKFLDEAVEGVVYFSLGCHVRSVNLDEKLRKTILGALSELPYKVLWKWESDHLPGKPDNVMTRRWLPQLDVLAHPNVKVFVTQGGHQSTEEAIDRQVPMVGMPFMCEQPMIVQKLVELGVGLQVDPNTVTKEELKRSIVEVVEDSRFKRRIEEVRALVYDRPMNGLDKAIWWMEYVIRHRGAKHLRSARADMSWSHFLLLDVFAAIVVLLWSIYRILKLLLSSRKK